MFPLALMKQMVNSDSPLKGRRFGGTTSTERTKETGRLIRSRAWAECRGSDGRCTLVYKDAVFQSDL